MPQTRFVTRKALGMGHKAIVVVNKIDRPGARPGWVVDKTFELFDRLAPPTRSWIFQSSMRQPCRAGRASTAPSGPRT